MAINLVGEEVERRRPVTLPKLNLPDIDHELEAKETAERVARERTIRAGLDAWAEINKTQSFSGWAKIGAALAVGKQHALHVTDPDAPWWAQRYGEKFSDWCKRHGFGGMVAADRSNAIELYENLAAIEQWLATLPERQRRRLIHPQTVTRRWKAAMGQYQAMRVRDVRSAAQYAWKRFLACVQALPPDQQAPLWRAVADAMAEP